MSDPNELVKPDEFTEEEWDALSSEEQGALAEPEDDADPNPDHDAKSDGQDDPDDKGDDPEDKDEDDPEKDDPDKKGDSEDDPDDKGGDEPKDDPDGDDPEDKGGDEGDPEKGTPAPKPDLTPALSDDVPPELQGRLDELKAKYEAGDLELPEFMDQRDTVKHDIFNHQVALGNWQKIQETFLEGHQIYQGNPVLLGALDAEVRRLGGSEDGQSHGDQWCLEQAHRNLGEAFGAPGSGKDPDPGPDKGRENKGGKKPKQDPPDSPDLGAAPAADDPNESKGEFDNLDGLDGLDLERALNAMPDEKRERYLAEG